MWSSASRRGKVTPDSSRTEPNGTEWGKRVETILQNVACHPSRYTWLLSPHLYLLVSARCSPFQPISVHCSYILKIWWYLSRNIQFNSVEMFLCHRIDILISKIAISLIELGWLVWFWIVIVSQVDEVHSSAIGGRAESSITCG